MSRMKRAILIVGAACALSAGCVRVHHDLSRTNWVTERPHARRTPPRWRTWFKNTYVYPVARWLTPPAGEAANVDEAGRVPTSSFYVDRDVSRLTPEEIERGPCRRLDVPTPITIRKVKEHPVKPGFFGVDAEGRKYLFKFDPPGYPELCTGAEAVATRLLWACGYRVPANRICLVEGTGDARFDGRRALASEFIEGEILGPWLFRDAYRRREMRALKVVAAWINNTDTCDHNTLVVWRDGRAWYYLLDFDNSLGAHTYGPKKPWHGWRYKWDVEEQLLALGTLGLSLVRPVPYRPPAPVVSPAVGRFDARVDPRRFKNAFPNYAFREMRRSDAVWMARKLAQFTPEQIRAAVRAGRYSNKRDEDYLVKTLLERRDAICRIYGVPVPSRP